MIGQATGHRWREQHFSTPPLGLGSLPAQFVMGPTQIVGTTKQPHAAFQRRQAPGRMPTLARQAGESLADRAVQAFNKSGIEHSSAMRSRKAAPALVPAFLEPSCA